MSSYNNKLPPGARPEKKIIPSGDVIVHMPHNRQYYFNSKRQTVDQVDIQNSMSVKMHNMMKKDQKIASLKLNIQNSMSIKV
jgi:hypothetical protein